MSKVVVIHQPNFFPWLGYFDKIACSDVFIFLDDVQFPKTGGVWTNRVKLLISDEARWITAAVDRNYHGTRTIREMKFLADNSWRDKLLKSIESNYCRHPFYRETINIIAPLLLNAEANIAEYNIHAITTIASRIGLNTDKLRRSSDLPHEGSSNELLCSLTQAVGGETYMCGGGADGYQDETVFAKRGVKLRFQGFTHPSYRQLHREGSVTGLSIIDAAMNLGWVGLGSLFSTRPC